MRGVLGKQYQHKAEVIEALRLLLIIRKRKFLYLLMQRLFQINTLLGLTVFKEMSGLEK